MGPPSEVARLYTDSNAAYLRFVRAVLYPQGIRAYFMASPLVRAGQYVLDAGCGTGIVSFALREALAARGLSAGPIDAFDLTPAMLAMFSESMAASGTEDIRMVQSDVLSLDSLPAGWSGYDLIVSSGMLEYLLSDRLAAALSSLRERLGPDAMLVVFITRRNWLTRPLIGSWWHANLYSEGELRERFTAAGFSEIAFSGFPGPYRYLGAWGHVIEARP